MFYSPGENCDSLPTHTKFSGGKMDPKKDLEKFLAHYIRSPFQVLSFISNDQLEDQGRSLVLFKMNNWRIRDGP